MVANQSSLLGASDSPRSSRDLSAPLGALGEVPLEEAGIPESELSTSFVPHPVDADAV